MKCAETTDIYLEEPPNLTAQENGLEIFSGLGCAIGLYRNW